MQLNINNLPPKTRMFFQCLKWVAKTIAQQVTKPDEVAVRYGGEEFAILLPQSKLSDAQSVANQLIAQLEQQAIEHKASPLGVVSVSAGVASISQIQPHEDLFTVADKSLFLAKRAGRNAFA